MDEPRWTKREPRWAKQSDIDEARWAFCKKKNGKTMMTNLTSSLCQLVDRGLCDRGHEVPLRWVLVFPNLVGFPALRSVEICGFEP